MPAAKNPDCPYADDPTQCRITVHSYVVEPILLYEPIMDGNGNVTNADPNRHVSEMSCSTCNMEWTAETEAGSEIKVTRRRAAE